MNRDRVLATTGTLALCALFATGCATGQTFPPATASPAPVATASTLTAEPAAPAAPETTAGTGTTEATPTTTPATVVNIVTLGDTFDDSAAGISISLDEATDWIPSLPTSADSGLFVRMVGVHMTVDDSAATYDTDPNAGDFTLLASDGSTTPCAALRQDDASKTYSDAIIGALGGGEAYDPPTQLSGWFVCSTSPDNDADFDATGYTIHYDRAATTGTDGSALPEFTLDAPVQL
jgi:hypothetical protein